MKRDKKNGDLLENERQLILKISTEFDKAIVAQLIHKPDTMIDYYDVAHKCLIQNTGKGFLISKFYFEWFDSCNIQSEVYPSSIVRDSVCVKMLDSILNKIGHTQWECQTSLSRENMFIPSSRKSIMPLLSKDLVEEFKIFYIKVTF